MASEEPRRTQTKGNVLGDNREEHPAFGQIGAFRASCSPGILLYGSDFEHRSVMSIEIKRSSLARGLSNDWPLAGEELIRVTMSEAQWATFVSTPNSGHGVQCTIERIRGEGQIPSIARTVDRRQQFGQELQQTIAKGMAALESLQATLADPDVKMPAAARTRLKDHADTVRRELVANVPYVVQAAGEHVEKNIERARVEVHAYIEGAVRRAGLESLHGSEPFRLQEPEGGQDGAGDETTQGGG